MGCSHSIPDNHPSMFSAKNVDEHEKSKNSVFLEVKSQKLFVHSKRKKMMASWPITCLQRYGFNDELLLIETGHGCDTGQGIFLFKCHRATQLFDKLKDAWNDIQDQNMRAMSIAYPHQMSMMTGTTALPSTSYYNTNGSGSNGVPLTAGLSSVSGHPSTSNSRYTPPTPGTRGSASSRNTGVSGSRGSLPRTFELQPAPAGRQEMLDRRRINSNMVSYNRQNESVRINHTRHHTVAADCEYENSDVIQQHKNERLKAPEGVVAFNTNSEHITFPRQRESPEMPPRGISANSLRSDGDHPLTPISNSTSGIGSLNGNSTTSEGKCNGGAAISTALATNNPIPPPLPPIDPWRKQNGWAKQRKSHARRLRHINDFTSRLSPGMPMSARDYVNTVNASLDVSGTPLPATAAPIGGNHFSFDFDPRMLTGNNANPFQHRHNIDYVPIEVSTKNGDFYSCGSASSGLPGTPLTPRTPGGHLLSCDYAEIDHNKTRALSNAFRSRQREMKSRHTSSETTGLMNGNL
ncbi:uncharacterized protein LOC120335750 [Styela clava]